MNMSFMLTEPQVRAETKDVTRRLGWRKLKAGDRVWPVRKCQGLKPGENVQRVGHKQLVVTEVRRERLDALLADLTYGRAEVDREGFPKLTVAEFVHMFCREMKCTPETEITRIAFRYEG